MRVLLYSLGTGAGTASTFIFFNYKFSFTFSRMLLTRVILLVYVVNINISSGVNFDNNLYTERTVLLPLISIHVISNECSYYKNFNKKMPLSLQGFILFQNLVLLTRHLVLLQRVTCTWKHVKYIRNLHVNSINVCIKDFQNYFSLCTVFLLTKYFLSVYSLLIN